MLFLDEPTTGLDPRSRMSLWDVIAELKSEGTTIVLTTQYMEEADHLADTHQRDRRRPHHRRGDGRRAEAPWSAATCSTSRSRTAPMSAAAVVGADARVQPRRARPHRRPRARHRGRADQRGRARAHPGAPRARRRTRSDRWTSASAARRSTTCSSTSPATTRDDEIREEQPEPRPLTKRRRDS